MSDQTGAALALSDAEVIALVCDQIPESSVELLERKSPAWLGSSSLLVRLRVIPDDPSRFAREGFVLISEPDSSPPVSRRTPPLSAEGHSPQSAAEQRLAHPVLHQLFEACNPNELLRKIPALSLSDSTIEDYVRTFAPLLFAYSGEQMLERVEDADWKTPLLGPERAELAGQLASNPVKIERNSEHEYRATLPLLRRGTLWVETLEIVRLAQQSYYRSTVVGDMSRVPGSHRVLVGGLPDNHIAVGRSRAPGSFRLVDTAPSEGWEYLDPKEAGAIIQDLNRHVVPHLPLPLRCVVQKQRISCYGERTLLRISCQIEGQPHTLLVLWAPGFVAILDSTSGPIHDLNRRLQREEGWGLRSPAQAAEYVRFFCNTVWGDDGPFSIVESPDDSRLSAERMRGSVEEIAAARAIVEPLSASAASDGADFQYVVKSCVLYGRALYSCALRVNTSGEVDMLEDTVLVPVDVPPPTRYSSMLAVRFPPRPLSQLTPADELLKRLTSSQTPQPGLPHEIQDLTVYGPVHAEALSLEKNTRFRRCRFRGRVSLTSLQALQNLAFEDCVFEGGLDLSSAKLDAGLELKSCSVLGPAPGEECLSMRDLRARTLNLREVWVQGLLTLDQSSLEQHVAFEHIRVGDHLSLYGVTVDKNFVQLTDVGTDGDVDATFLRCGTGLFIHAGVRGSRIGGTLELGGAQVGSIVRVRGQEIAGSLFASASRIGDFRLEPLSITRESEGEPRPEARALRIGGNVDLSMAEVRGSVTVLGVEPLPAATHLQQKLSLRHAQVAGDVSLWASGSTRITELLGRGAGEFPDAELGSSFPGGVSLSNANVGGDVDLSHVQASEGPIDFEDAVVKHDVQIVLCTQKRERARARWLSLDGFCCEGSVDVTGIDLVPEKVEGPEQRLGGMSGRNLAVRRQLRIATKASSANVPGQLDLGDCNVGSLEISPASFFGNPTREELSASGISLNRATIGRLAIFSADRRLPRPIDLRNSQITCWEFRSESDIRTDIARDYIELLQGDPDLQRQTFRAVENNLYNQGHEEAADEIHKEMRRWLRLQAAKTSGAGLAWPLRWVALQLRTFWDVLTDSVTSPNRMLWLVTAWTVASCVLFAIPQNISPTEEALAFTYEPVLQEDVPEAELWGLRQGAWLALRHHVPVIELTAQDDWEPSGSRQLHLPFRWLCPWLTAEDYANLVMAVHWILWPMIIVIFSRKFLRRVTT